MPSIFNSLPGLEVPAGAISNSLAQMWSDTAASGKAAPGADDVKATQINLVLHLGFSTTGEDAAQQFQTAVRFSQRYPSRVVVICPEPPDDPGTEIRAKIYGECFLGKSKDDTRCCEFVMLSYPSATRPFLEAQVSTCLSTDLPVYYWAHRFSSSARLNDYQYLLRTAKRVIIDSSIAPDDALSFPWPRPDAVRDLVHARLLPVRQSIGQFLSSYKPALLVEGLTVVRVQAHPSVRAEGRVLVNWLRERLVNCGAKNEVEYVADTVAEREAQSLSVSFAYRGTKMFLATANFEQRQARLEADFGSGKTELPIAVSLLSPEAALGEAMFF